MEITNKDNEIQSSDSALDLIGFSGKLTAGYTHEINNVLGIIEQSAGLMEDIYSLLAGQISDKYLDKFKDTVSTIEEQVQRGILLTGALNKFSHSPDDIKILVDMNETLDFMTKLCVRFANLKQIVLKFLKQDGVDEIYTNPVFLNYVVYNAVFACLDVTPEGNEIIITTAKNTDHISLSFAIKEQVGMAKVNNIKKTEYWKVLEKFSALINAVPIIDIHIPGIIIDFPLKL